MYSDSGQHRGADLDDLGLGALVGLRELERRVLELEAVDQDQVRVAEQPGDARVGLEGVAVGALRDDAPDVDEVPADVGRDRGHRRDGRGDEELVALPIAPAESSDWLHPVSTRPAARPSATIRMSTSLPRPPRVARATTKPRVGPAFLQKSRKNTRHAARRAPQVIDAWKMLSIEASRAASNSVRALLGAQALGQRPGEAGDDAVVAGQQRVGLAPGCSRRTARRRAGRWGAPRARRRSRPARAG